MSTDSAPAAFIRFDTDDGVGEFVPSSLHGRPASAFDRWTGIEVDTPPRVPPVELPGAEAPPAPATPDAGEAERTERELEALRGEARDEGYAAGLELGREDGRRELGSATAALDDAVRQLAEPLRSVDAATESALATLAVDIGAALFRHELRARPDQVTAIVREALDALPAPRTTVTVHLHPDDVPLVEAAAREQPMGWTVLADAALERGGCRVVSDSSEVDATVTSRVAALVAALEL